MPHRNQLPDAGQSRLIQRNRRLRTRCLDVAGTSALPRVRAERELRNQQNAPADLLNREVRNLVFVVKHADSGYLVTNIGHIRLKVAFLNAQKHNETAPDLTYDLPVYHDGGLRCALYDRSHLFPYPLYRFMR
ncbi:hypothetical protein SDC9_192348 [bioreactor metagenome]|uniref:Uncharacterized protein n=1 Tax=bioreactor metagenome TaxID=1076179 RepID=A0A645IBH7_9ZZZZ